MTYTPPASAADRAELARFIRRLHQTQQRIQTLAGGTVDAVLEPFSGSAYLLPDAQAHLRRSEMEQRRLADALRVSEERFRLLSNATNDAIWDWDLDTDALWWNEGFEALSGFRRSEVEPTIASWKGRIHSDDAARVISSIHRAIEGGGENWSAEYRFHRKDGTYAYVLDRGHVIRAPDGKALRMIGGMTDLTERKLTEVRLAEQGALLDVARDAILVLSVDRRVQFWNRSAERMYGWPAAEALGRSIDELLHSDPTGLQKATAATLNHGHWTGRVEQHRRDGTPLTVQGSWTLVRAPDGEPRSILAVNTDITDNLVLEEQLRQSQRLETVGQLTGGIAHDFNNLLTVIVGSAELLTEGLAHDNALRRYAEMNTAAALRGAELTQRLLAFSRRQPLEPRVSDIDGLLAGMSGLLRQGLSESISIEFVRGSALWNALVDPGQLESAVLNLCLNAGDAMADGGDLTIETANVYLDSAYAESHAEVAPGQYVMISVTDTGTGIPAHIIKKVFDPFFTTKEQGKGTGLGLSMVYGFIKQSGGHVQIGSEAGHGTTVKLFLPRVVGRVEVEHEQGDGTVTRGGTETILTVEDDELVRSHAVSQLRALGYRVLAASNGPRAMDILRRDPKIDLLFTDMIMPGGMDGKQLAEAARQVKPGLKVLFTTGKAENAFVLHGRVEATAHLLSKPYRRADLARMIRMALTQSEGAPSGAEKKLVGATGFEPATPRPPV